ncbi:MAG: DNA N-6-adenine-methyltransferase [Nitrosotalea sp.]
MTSRSVQHLQNITVQDEYGTPRPLFRKAIMEYDVLPFIDVCATPLNAMVQTYFTKQDDALTKEWNLDFFMNPPYSRVKEFVSYAYNEHIRHNVTGLILTYAKTDTIWWHEYVEKKAEVHFIKGRVKFLRDGQVTAHPAPYPSVWIIFRKK